MTLTVSDLIKIRKTLQPDFQDLEDRMERLISTKASNSDVNVLKDLILDIRDRLDIVQIPFIEKAVDANSKKIMAHDKRITILEEENLI